MASNAPPCQPAPDRRCCCAPPPPSPPTASSVPAPGAPLIGAPPLAFGVGVVLASSAAALAGVLAGRWDELVAVNRRPPRDDGAVSCGACQGTGYVDCFCTRWDYSSLQSDDGTLNLIVEFTYAARQHVRRPPSSLVLVAKPTKLSCLGVVCSMLLWQRAWSRCAGGVAIAGYLPCVAPFAMYLRVVWHGL